MHAGRKERDLIERDVTVRLAGPMVEALVSGRWNHVGASSDYEFSWNLLEYPCGDLCEVNRYFNRLLVRTEVMFVNVDPNWRAVEQFAEVLLRKKTIGSRRAREIVLEALRSSTAALTGTGQERR